MSQMKRHSGSREIDRLLACLRCVGCGSTVIDARTREASGGNPASFTCGECGRTTRVSGDIIDCLPAGDGQLTVWDKHYSSTDQSPLVRALEKGFERPSVLHAHYSILRLLERLSLPVEQSIELGAGSGAFSLVLKKLGFVEHVTLLDYSSQALNAARDLFAHFDEKCTLVKASIDSVPFPDDSFDLSLSAGVIEHYPSTQERIACFKAHTSVAKHAFIQAPVSSPCYWASRLVYSAINKGWPFGYEKPVTMRELRRMAGETGVRIIGRDHQYFLSWPLFTKIHRLVTPTWYTWPFQNEISILVSS